MSSGVPIVTRKTSSSTLSIPPCSPLYPFRTPSNKEENDADNDAISLQQTRYTDDHVESYRSCATDETKRYSALLTVYYDLMETDLGERKGAEDATPNNASKVDDEVKYNNSSTCQRTRTTVAEVHIQLSHLGMPFEQASTQVARIPLLATRESISLQKEERQREEETKLEEEESCGIQKRIGNHRCPSIVFAKSNTHLYCIIPKPKRPTTQGTTTDTTETSTLLICKISTHRIASIETKARVPLPSYISTPSTIPNPSPLPHLYEPKVLTATMAMSSNLYQGEDEELDIDETAQLLSQIIYLLPFTQTLMLAACSDGQMLLITCQGSLLGVLSCKDDCTDKNLNGYVRCMDASWKKDEKEEDNEGRLVVVYKDGTVNIFGLLLGPLVSEVEKQDSEDGSWTQVQHSTENYTNGHSNGHRNLIEKQERHVTEAIPNIIQSRTHNLQLQVTDLGYLDTLHNMCHALFVGYSWVALLVDPLSCTKPVDSDDDCRAQVWDVGFDESKFDISLPTLMSELKLGVNSLSELPNETLAEAEMVPYGHGNDEGLLTPEWSIENSFSLQSGIDSNSVVVNSAACIHSFKSNPPSFLKLKKFGLIWDWNKCWTGFSLIHADEFTFPRFETSDLLPQLCEKRFSFACMSHDSRERRFIHMTNLNCIGGKVRKEIWSMGLLCPSPCRSRIERKELCHDPTPLFCTENAISYPCFLDVSD